MTLNTTCAQPPTRSLQEAKNKSAPQSMRCVDTNAHQGKGSNTRCLDPHARHQNQPLYSNPTDLAPIAPKLDYDLLARLVDGTHRRGMKFAAYVR